MRAVVIIATAGVAALSLLPGPAWAQANRTFVSGFGSDANPCSLSAPCRSFQQAHDTVAAGGEIVALDAAGYGPLAISKAITVTAIGVAASITSNSINAALSINAGLGDVVSIRGLTLFAGATSGDGIAILSAKSVNLRECSISGFAGQGISITPSNTLDVEVTDVYAGYNGQHGLSLDPTGSGGVVTMAVTRSQFGANGLDGVFVTGESSSDILTATLSVDAAANGGAGILVQTGPTGFQPLTQPLVMITGSKLTNNGSGLLGLNLVKVLVDRTQISGNAGMGWNAAGGAVVKTYANNEVNGNTDDNLNGVVQTPTK